MTDLSFWDIYLPVLTAILSSIALFELAHVGLSYLYTKHQMQKYLDFQAKVQSGEIEMPPELLGQMGGSPLGGHMGMFPGAMPPGQGGTTVSGEGPGQYL
jgi:hypothetical protein